MFPAAYLTNLLFFCEFVLWLLCPVAKHKALSIYIIYFNGALAYGLSKVRKQYR